MSKYPADWPGPGRIDLQIHDLPHASSSTEWWYVNCHLKTDLETEVSIFASFFRVLRGVDQQTQEAEYAHFITWAVSDVEQQAYHSQSVLDRCVPEIGLDRLRNGSVTPDSRVNRALEEVLKKGQVPAPERLFTGEVSVCLDRLDLDYDGLVFRKLEDGNYELLLRHPDGTVGCSLTLSPQKEAVRHGSDGVVAGKAGEDMFYYFVPRCRVEGTVTLSGVESSAAGTGWYDHEFGRHQPDQTGESENRTSSWNWCSIQLDDGRDLSGYTIVSDATNEIVDQHLVVVDSHGKSKEYAEIHFDPVRMWRSNRIFADYPTLWRVSVPDAEIDLEIEASFDDQEFITCTSKPAFWEGRCNVRGRIGGTEVAGLAFVERSGFETMSNLDDFFRSVSEVVQKSVRDLLPFEPTYEQVRDLIASKEREHYMEGVDINAFVRTGVRPIREITDRGGKAWRSYAALLCCDIVGGDSRKFVHWLAMPELIHVGSMIVDDVQDKSTTRRGGPSCHVVYGEPLAINAGTAAYFMGQHLLYGTDVSDKEKLRLYDLYFEALRTGHAGQAADLDGVGNIVAEVVQSGESEDLEKRVLACYRLKTAAPAAALARMGAVVGGGSETQIEALGRYFEATGLAFQTIDDVLNLRGFQNSLKSRGEDITNGTVTLLVAKALGRLDFAKRVWLWERLQAHLEAADDIAEIIEALEDCGAVEECNQQARELIEQAWQKYEGEFTDSISKVMMRAFGWYVLERHY